MAGSGDTCHPHDRVAASHASPSNRDARSAEADSSVIGPRITSQMATVAPNAETVEFIYDNSKGAPDLQFRAADALDSKLAQALGAASVVLGLAAVGGTHRNVSLLTVAVLAYAVVAITALSALWTRPLRVPVSPTQLWRRYWNDDVPDIRHALVK